MLEAFSPLAAMPPSCPPGICTPVRSLPTRGIRRSLTHCCFDGNRLEEAAVAAALEAAKAVPGSTCWGTNSDELSGRVNLWRRVRRTGMGLEDEQVANPRLFKSHERASGLKRV